MWRRSAPGWMRAVGAMPAAAQRCSRRRAGGEERRAERRAAAPVLGVKAWAPAIAAIAATPDRRPTLALGAAAPTREEAVARALSRRPRTTTPCIQDRWRGVQNDCSGRRTWGGRKCCARWGGGGWCAQRRPALSCSAPLSASWLWRLQCLHAGVVMGTVPGGVQQPPSAASCTQAPVRSPGALAPWRPTSDLLLELGCNVGALSIQHLHDMLCCQGPCTHWNARGTWAYPRRRPQVRRAPPPALPSKVPPRPLRPVCARNSPQGRRPAHPMGTVAEEVQVVGSESGATRQALRRRRRHSCVLTTKLLGPPAPCPACVSPEP